MYDCPKDAVRMIKIDFSKLIIQTVIHS